MGPVPSTCAALSTRKAAESRKNDSKNPAEMLMILSSCLLTMRDPAAPDGVLGCSSFRDPARSIGLGVDIRSSDDQIWWFDVAPTPHRNRRLSVCCREPQRESHPYSTTLQPRSSPAATGSLIPALRVLPWPLLPMQSLRRLSSPQLTTMRRECSPLRPRCCTL